MTGQPINPRHSNSADLRWQKDAILAHGAQMMGTSESLFQIGDKYGEWGYSEKAMALIAEDQNWDRGKENW